MARDAWSRRRGGRYRYGEWAGGPDPLAPPYDVRAALDRVGQEVLNGGSLREALRDLLRRGPDGRSGLEDLRARAARMRREAARRGDLDGALTTARAQLDQALAAEREELAGRDGDDAGSPRPASTPSPAPPPRPCATWRTTRGLGAGAAAVTSRSSTGCARTSWASSSAA